MGHPVSAAMRTFFRKSDEREGTLDLDNSQAKNKTHSGVWFSHTKL
jgi:hypothetical protein